MTFQSHVGQRLKEERVSLGLSQAEAAKATGVTREHWGRCERGAAVPGGEMLAGFSLLGGDIVYVLTGNLSKRVTSPGLEEGSKGALTHLLTDDDATASDEKSASKVALTRPLSEGKLGPNRAKSHGLPTQSVPGPLTRDEEILLDNYRHTPPDLRRFVIDAAFVASQRKTAKGGK